MNCFKINLELVQDFEDRGQSIWGIEIIYVVSDINGFAAVEDWGLTLRGQIIDEADIIQRRVDRQMCQRLIAEATQTYQLSRRPFCAGFFIFSTDIIQENTFSDLLTMTDRYDMICKYSEQTILNFYFHD